jgi:hypothetical protein
MLFDIDLHEYFVDVEGIAKPLVFSLQASGIFGAKFDALEPNSFIADSDSTLSLQIFYEWSGTPAMC